MLIFYSELVFLRILRHILKCQSPRNKLYLLFPGTPPTEHHFKVNISLRFGGTSSMYLGDMKDNFKLLILRRRVLHFASSAHEEAMSTGQMVLGKTVLYLPLQVLSFNS